jgi:hypothetical protein
VEFSLLSEGRRLRLLLHADGGVWLRQRDTLRARFGTAAGLNLSGWLKTTIEKLSREMAGSSNPFEVGVGPLEAGFEPEKSLVRKILFSQPNWGVLDELYRTL